MMSVFSNFQPTLNSLFINCVKCKVIVVLLKYEEGEDQIDSLPGKKQLSKSPALLGLNSER